MVNSTILRTQQVNPAMTSSRLPLALTFVAYAMALMISCVSAFIPCTPHLRSNGLRSLPTRQQGSPVTSGTSSRKVCCARTLRPSREMSIDGGITTRLPWRWSSRNGDTPVMMAEGSSAGGKFVKMGGAEDTQSFGPRCVVAGGLSTSEFSDLQLVLREEDETAETDESRTPSIQITPDLADSTLGDLLGDAATVSAGQYDGGKGGLNVVSLPSPVILLSGFTNSQVRGVASRFRQLTGVRAAFAKAVPNAMTKTASRLFGEIAQDHADALAGRLQKPQGS